MKKAYTCTTSTCQRTLIALIKQYKLISRTELQIERVQVQARHDSLVLESGILSACYQRAPQVPLIGLPKGMPCIIMCV